MPSPLTQAQYDRVSGIKTSDSGDIDRTARVAFASEEPKLGISPHTVSCAICDAELALLAYGEPFHVQNVNADRHPSKTSLHLFRDRVDRHANGVRR